MVPVEADEIVTRIWQGSKPFIGKYVGLAGFDVLVLCAEEYQMPAGCFPNVEVIHAPNEDSFGRLPFTQAQKKLAVQAANRVVEAHREGKKILITCYAGLNRSGLVTALSLHLLFGWSGQFCVDTVKARRTRPWSDAPHPLSNPDFTDYLEKLPGESPFILPGDPRFP